MKRIPILVFVLLLMGKMVLYASPVDTSMVKTVALNFFQSQVSQGAQNLPVQQEVRIVYTHPFAREMNATHPDALYVCNIGQNGFVVVASDNRVEPVLGYSLTDPFDVGNIPPAMLWLFDDYAWQIAGLDQSETEIPEHPQWELLMVGMMLTQNAANWIVAPLVTTSWDQGDYYNEWCPYRCIIDSIPPVADQYQTQSEIISPEDAVGNDTILNNHVYVGCMATAMAQVVHYWFKSKSITGVGSHTNTQSLGDSVCENNPMTVNFGATTYHHGQMPSKLTSSTQPGADEVAKLLYHCGIAINMKYKYNVSSANLSSIKTALSDHFRVTHTKMYSKSTWVNEVPWDEMLRLQLDSLRPVLYRGAPPTEGSGHGFIIDGYDLGGYFHINWGWSGSYQNAHYSLTDLTPGAFNFNGGQYALICYNPVPTMAVQARKVDFKAVNATPSDVKSVVVKNQYLTHNISVSVAAPFEVSNSSNENTFGHSTTIAAGTNTLYIRYSPSQSLHNEVHNGQVTLVYEDVTETIDLTGYHLVLIPPKPETVTATPVYPDKMQISWQESSILTTPQTDVLSFEDNWVTSYKPSLGDYKVSMIHRLEGTDLISNAPYQLTDVSFVAIAGVQDYKLVVYEAGGIQDGILSSGVQIACQPIDISTLTMGGWNTVALNTPIDVNVEKELWVGVYVEAPGNVYALPVGSSDSYLPEKGNVIAYHNDDGTDNWGLFPVGSNFSLKYHFRRHHFHLSHYEIFRDNQLIDTTVDTFSVDTLYQDGLYNYRVNAVYADSTEADTTVSVFYEVPLAADTVHATFCQNDTYDFFGTALDQAGEYSHNANHLYTVLYLDSLPLSESNDTLTLCTCDLPYTWNSLQITAAGNYVDTLVAANGCDSTAHLKVTTVVPQLYVDEKPLSFVAYDTAVSDVKSIVVRGNAYALGTTVTVSSPFEVSSDSVSFGSSLTLSPLDTTVYVRYRPLQIGANNSHSGQLTVSFASIQKQVTLRGHHIETVYPAPENLQYSMIFPDTVHLSWQAPSGLEQTTMTLSHDPVMTGWAWGYQNNYRVTTLHRYCDSDLVSVSPSLLTGVSFVPKQAATLYKAVAYKGGFYQDSVLHPGTLVSEKIIDMTGLSYNTWNTVDFDIPVPVEADEELWVGIYLEAPGSSYTISVGDTATYVPEKGDVTAYHTTVGESWFFFDVHRNFSLKAEFQLQPPALQHYDVYQNDSLMASVGVETEYKFKKQLDECDYRVTAVYDGQKSASDSVHFLMVPEIVVDAAALEHLVMISVDNNPSEPVSIDIFGLGTSHPLNMSVTGPFEVGYDTASFAQLLAFPNDSTHLLIRYAPVPTAKSYCEYGNLSIVYDTLSVDVPLKGYRIIKDYPAPGNLHHTHILPDTVELAWQEPPLVTNHYAAYDTNWASSYMYLNGDYKVAMLNRYCDTDLVHFYPGKLSHIKFIAPTGITQCRAVVYQGGRVVDGVLTPGTQIVNQTVNVSSLNMNQWNVVTLNEPITVDLSQELWFGVYIEADSGYYTMAVGDSTTYVPGKGNIEALYLPNGNVFWRFFNHNVNFLISGVFQSDPLELSHYRVQRGDSVLCTTTLTEHNDVVPAPGTYHYSVTAVYSDGGEGQATINPYINAPLYYDTVNAVICANETYNFFNTHLQQPGHYHHFANQTWSVLDLAVLEVPDVTISASALYLPTPGDVTLTASGADSYVWNTGSTSSVIYVHPETTTLYSVTGTSSSTGCSNTASVTIEVADVGVDDLSLLDISLYPNPVHDKFTVKGEFDNLILYDVWGRPVLKTSLIDGDHLEISVADLAAGTYFLYVIKQGVLVHTFKVVVM